MILRTINQNPLFQRVILPFLSKWVEDKIARFIEFIPFGHNLLDLGCGNCCVSQRLIEKGYKVASIDIKNLSIIESIHPVIYDGECLPYHDDFFDIALILTVLHHADNPEKLILESKRVAKQLIIIEDTYSNLIQKLLTQLVDSIVNLGHSKMTYQNKSEKEWESLFESNNLDVLSKKAKSTLFFFQQTTYHLQKRL